MLQRPCYALLIGINRYASATVPDLLGCENDVLALRDLLQNGLGLSAGAIAVLTNEAATQGAIRQAFRTHLLAPLQAAAAGQPAQKKAEQPAILFYFSGHGSQAPALDKPTGLDETLVPHDSRTEGVYDIHDRELGLWLAELAQYTTNVTVILDCCHSGSGTRLDKKHTTDVRACPRDDRPQPAPTSLLPAMRGALGANQSSLQPAHVLLAACGNHERAREDTLGTPPLRHGIFTYWLLQALRTQPPHEPLTYRDLYDRVRHQLHRAYGNVDAQRIQTPQCEGDRDRLFLGDLRAVRNRWLTVIAEREGLIWVDSGQAQGLSVGTILHLYPQTVDMTSAPQTAPVAIVQVETVAAVESGCVRLDTPPLAPLPAGARAFVYRYGQGRQRIKVALDLPEGMVLNIIRDRLSQPDIYPAIELALPHEGAALRLTKTGETFELWRGDRQQRFQGYDARQLNPYRRPFAPKDLDPIVRDLSHLVQQAQVGAIGSPAGSEIVAALQITLEQVLPARHDNEFPTAPVAIDDAGNRLLLVDTPFILSITNGYTQPLYLTVLELGYQGDVRQVYPQIAGANEAVAQGKTLVIGRTRDPGGQLTMQLPPGVPSIEERLKIIATTEEANFDYLLQGDLPSQQGTGQVMRGGELHQASATRAYKRVSEILPEDRWGSSEIRVKVVCAAN